MVCGLSSIACRAGTQESYFLACADFSTFLRGLPITGPRVVPGQLEPGLGESTIPNTFYSFVSPSLSFSASLTSLTSPRLHCGVAVKGVTLQLGVTLSVCSAGSGTAPTSHRSSSLHIKYLSSGRKAPLIHTSRLARYGCHGHCVMWTVAQLLPYNDPAVRIVVKHRQTFAAHRRQLLVNSWCCYEDEQGRSTTTLTPEHRRTIGRL